MSLTGEGCDLGNPGVWDRDYGWGVRVRRHLAHAGGVLYSMELGSVTLKINNQHTPTGAAQVQTSPGRGLLAKQDRDD